MAKETGLGAGFFVDGYDLSGDSGAFDRISKNMATITKPGIDVYAQERVSGRLDGGIGWTSYFNPDRAHAVLATLPRGDVLGSYWHKQSVLGTPVASCVAKQIDYAPTRGADGDLNMKITIESNAWWVDWGYALTTGKRTDTAATNGTGVDFGDPSPAAFSYGLQAYLHVFAFTGTNATIKLQQSSDNGAGDAWSDVVGGAFASVTSGPQAQRIETARDLAVERYLRVVTTGTFTSLQFAVATTVNTSEMTI